MPQHFNNLKQIMHILERPGHDGDAPPDLHKRLRKLLSAIRHGLSQNSKNARIVTQSLQIMTVHGRLSEEEMMRANRALKELMKSMGVTVIALLPGAVITLPTLFALARHFNIALLASETSIDPGTHQGDTSREMTHDNSAE